MIMRDDLKKLWVRTNNKYQCYEVNLVERPRYGDYCECVAIQVDSCNSGICEFTEEQFFEMVQAGAEYFGKKVTFEEIPLPCPGCGNTRYRFSEVPGSYWKKECRTCGMAGPTATTRQKADQLWRETFERLCIDWTGKSKPITITEELDRR